ncbi:preprotein translocase subunit SecY [Candidatus Pacearchaeota archaeon]|nr:preprotein translocase subunit SecY [Candidatus Pacearchaeota archaeon]
MALDIRPLVYNIPEVRKPAEKKLSFNVKLKWTLIILGAFFVLANIPLYGLAKNSLDRFEYLAIILGTDFGSVISLGIGPIVMASIILQLLVGSGIMNIDTKSEEGKRYFQGLQKIGVLFFIIFEAMVYVLMGGLQANPGYTGIVILQLILGGIAIVLMDEVTTKWGFGSGVSLFIVAGVAWRLFAGLFQFLGPTGENCLADFGGTPCAGNVLIIIQSIINGDPAQATVAIATILVTVLIFVAVVWMQSLKVEIPLSYEKLRGYAVKWPLQFFYASNLPVILTAALVANLQLFGGLLQTWLGHPTILGEFSQGRPTSGFAYWLGSSNLVQNLIKGSLQSSEVLQAITHLIFYMALSAVFAVFWVKTSGMDESSQAKNILASGLQIPGFRKDQRVLESILKRYIMPLTIMGGLAIGLLASLADTLGALTSGTAILLAVTIMYQLYQNIAQQHALDMHPALRGMAG